jgi:formamidopyrimidine-DNA glycosylase
MELGKSLRWPLAWQLEGGEGQAFSAIVGSAVKAVRRRGKYLLLDLVASSGESAGVLLLHLGMSGSLRFAKNLGDAGKHDHFTLHTSRGSLRLHDPRRFGAVVYAPSESSAAAVKLLGGLGVEPLTADFAAPSFHAALKKRHAPIKQVLLAGDIVVGVGNIYASESLFLAGIRPTVKASNLSAPRAAKLHAAVVQVLQAALRQGGSTLRDFSSAEGQSGYFQLSANVYDRAGQPCRACASPIKTIRQGQRSTFYCMKCQKP